MMLRFSVATRFALSVTALALVMTGDLCAQMSRDTNSAAQLVAFTGQISVKRDEKTLWALNVGDYVYPQQVIVSGSDGTAMFKVTDGSTFEVFPKSTVCFRPVPYNWVDLLEVWLGKVRVQIEHPGGVSNSNKVKTPTAVISVRGTIFDVEYDSDADVTTVLDEEGSVEVARALRLNETRILNPNESMKIYRNESMGRAVFDKGGLMQRIAKAAMDALTQQAINSRSGSPSGGTPTSTGPSVSTTTTTTAGDHNGGTTTPTTPTVPPAPTAPPAPPTP